MLRYLFYFVEIFSMVMTAFLGSVFYLGGFFIAVIYRLIRGIYRTIKGGPQNGYVR